MILRISDFLVSSPRVSICLGHTFVLSWLPLPGLSWVVHTVSSRSLPDIFVFLVKQGRGGLKISELPYKSWSMGLEIFSFLFVYLCSHVYTYIYVCIYICTHVCMLVKASSQCLPQLFSILFLIRVLFLIRQGLSLNLGLAHWTRLSGQQTPRVTFSLPSQTWDYNCA